MSGLSSVVKQLLPKLPKLLYDINRYLSINMSQVWLYTLVSVAIVSLIPLVGVIVLFSKKKRPNLTLSLISLAVGALFGDVFIHIIPEILAEGESSTLIAVYLLLGILLFFILEKFLLWRHHHHIHSVKEECRELILPVGYMNLVSDGLHNFIDGAIIAGSFFIDTKLGIATTGAVILHEIPQEMGDIGILLHAGFSKAKALLFNILSGALAILGAVIALFLAGAVEAFAPFIDRKSVV